MLWNIFITRELPGFLQTRADHVIYIYIYIYLFSQENPPPNDLIISEDFIFLLLSAPNDSDDR